MKFLKTTLVGGLLVLLPLAACIAILAMTAKAAYDAVKPLTGLLNVREVDSIVLTCGIVAGSLLGACFFFGLLVRTAWGVALGRWIEDRILNVLPGYAMIRRLSRQLGGEAGETLGKPVLVRVADSRLFGFLVDELPGGEVAVYVPSTPILSVGTIHVVPKDRVEPLNVALTDYANVLGQFGHGAAAMIAPKP